MINFRNLVIATLCLFAWSSGLKASLVWSWSFGVVPTNVGPTDKVYIPATVTNHSSSTTNFVYNGTSASPTLGPIGSDQYKFDYGRDLTFPWEGTTEQWSGMQSLAPGESFSFTYATLTPYGTALPGTYGIAQTSPYPSGGPGALMCGVIGESPTCGRQAPKNEFLFKIGNATSGCRLSSAQIKDSVNLTYAGQTMIADFTPKNGCSLKNVAQELGYDHFNWVQTIQHYDGKLLRYDLMVLHWPAIFLYSTPLLDPPNGGWLRRRLDAFKKTADSLPYYWDETAGFEAGYFIGDHTSENQLSFNDTPRSGEIDQPGEHMRFVTSLVGVVRGSVWVPLHSFEWKSNYNGDSGGVSGARDISPVDGGTGGIYDVEVLDDPFDVVSEVKELWAANGAFSSRPVEVEFDIKPGDDSACLGRKAKGVIPVAILGASGSNVNAIDVSTLRLAGLAVSVKKNGSQECTFEDVDGDSSADLVCKFVNKSDAWVDHDGEVLLRGKLYDGTNIFGLRQTCLVP